MTNLLRNPGFEGNWWRKTFTGQEFGEIFVPEHWVAYWKEGGSVPHDPGNPIGYGRPEVHVINREPPFLDPLRVRGGSRAVKYFSFFRIHDAGLFQTVSGITPGTRLRATGWAHAWSSSRDNARVSDGVGDQAFFAKASAYRGDDAARNFTFRVGIDPKGGTDPWASSVVWGEGAHIYNVFAQIPAVEVTAQSTTVTVFVRSSVLWPFKHCDAYIDDMELIAVSTAPVVERKLSVVPDRPLEGEPFEVLVTGSELGALSLEFVNEALFQQAGKLEGTGVCWRCVAVAPGKYSLRITDAEQKTVLSGTVDVAERPAPVEVPSGLVPPREPYARTYLLLPPGLGDEWLQAVVDSGVWSRRRWTIGGSADDAGVGPASRRVIAVNPKGWPGDLTAFFAQYYPGAEVVLVEAQTPEELTRRLGSM